MIFYQLPVSSGSTTVELKEITELKEIKKWKKYRINYTFGPPSSNFNSIIHMFEISN